MDEAGMTASSPTRRSRPRLWTGLVACGGDGDDSEHRGSDTTEPEGRSGGNGGDYVDALAHALREGDTAATADDETAMCLAAATVDVVGADTLEAAGVSPGDLADAKTLPSTWVQGPWSLAVLDVEVPDDASTQLGAAFRECDVTGLFVVGFAAAVGELSDDAFGCLLDNVDHEAAADALATAFVDGADEGVVDVTSTALTTCPAATAAMIVTEDGANDTPEARTCVEGFLQANPAPLEALLTADSSATGDYFTQLAGVCPEAFAVR
jgi:hypothetical protein